MITQQFHPVSLERWGAIKTMMAHEANILIESDDDYAASHGIDFSWLYAAPMLTVTIDVPHFGWVLKMAGLHCEQDVMSAFAKKIEAIPIG
jgi:hypothetical protein